MGGEGEGRRERGIYIYIHYRCTDDDEVKNGGRMYLYMLSTILLNTSLTSEPDSKRRRERDIYIYICMSGI